MPGENDFDFAGASDSIGAELGFGESTGGDDPDLSVGGGEGEGAVAGEGATPAEETAAEGTGEGDKTAVAAAATSSEGTSAVPAPRTWRPEAAAEWSKLPPVVQAEIAKREEDMFRGLEGYKADAQTGKAFQQVLSPYNQIFQQYGINPVAQVNNLLQAHYQLAFGSQAEKTALIQRLISDYGVQVGEAPYVDPQVASLQQEIAALKSNLNGMVKGQETAVRADLNKQIEAFASDPAHPDFDAVAGDIAQLLRTGQAANLQDAYDKALWLNPATRAKQIERETANRAAAAKKEAEEKAAAARKATAANVTTRPKSASAAAPQGSFEDTLNATLAAINARA